jgi:phosphoribosylglycinamide formyltransferase-1
MKNIAVFASGSGTNAQNLIEYFQANPNLRVKLVICNKPDAGVIARAEKLNVPVKLFTKNELQDGEKLMATLREFQIDTIILAGFLLLIPSYLVQAFPNRIINIHPALLPKYGGKGMYGSKVHESVIDQGESESGITIHLVNEHYDEGAILFQAKCEVAANETPESLAQKIHTLEHQHYPKVIENYLLNQL